MSEVFGSGWNKVHEAKDNLDSGLWKLWVPADESRVVHFLTTEPVTYFQHTVRNAAGKWDSIICTQQDCPYCQQGERKSFVGSFLVLVRPHQSKGKEVGTRIRLYTPSMRVLNQLEKFPEDAEVEALDSVDIRISRTGAGTNTAYTLMPKPGKVTKEDDKVIKESLKVDSTDEKTLKELLVKFLQDDFEKVKARNTNLSTTEFAEESDEIPF